MHHQPTLDGIAELPAPRPPGRPTIKAAIEREAQVKRAVTAGLPDADATIALVMDHAEEFAPKFIAWLPDNMHVWSAFVAEAMKVSNRGFKHYSARTIIEVLRHHSALTERNGAGWKLNDHHTPYLSRLFCLTFPARAELFEKREAKAARRGF